MQAVPQAMLAEVSEAALAASVVWENCRHPCKQSSMRRESQATDWERRSGLELEPELERQASSLCELRPVQSCRQPTPSVAVTVVCAPPGPLTSQEIAITACQIRRRWCG